MSTILSPISHPVGQASPARPSEPGGGRHDWSDWYLTDEEDMGEGNWCKEQERITREQVERLLAEALAELTRLKQRG